MLRFSPLRTLLLLLFITLIQVQDTTASPVDSSMARKVATNFYNWRTGRSVTADHAQLTSVERTSLQGAVLQTSPVDIFYVFDFGGQFVMVSADTRVLPILGYSTESSFVIDNMPENIHGFLDDYTQQIVSALQHLTDEDCGTNVTQWEQWLTGNELMMATLNGVGPLLQTTWDQNSPYNSLCPVDNDGPGGHVYAGCVATAMAQIIRYWKYPPHGYSNHSYTANYSSSGYGNYGTQSVNFAAATYDYSLMPLSQNSNSPAAQINEVAKLMYHCGVAVDMMYGNNGSGAYSSDAANSFRNYYGFSGATVKYRTSYSSNAWITLIKGELDNLRPVLYNGHGTGGHAFVCDGYDNQNYFHFNWGWSGSSNGYFLLSSLTPGEHNYSSDNLAIIGVDVSQPMMQLGSKSMSFHTTAGTISASEPVSVMTAHVSSNITATVSSNFRISTNNSNFYTSRTLSNSGGTLYVRYHPTVSSGIEHGYIVLSTTGITDTIFLTGIVYDNTPYCLPPGNLSISTQDHDVTLQWTTPTVNPDPQTLSWATNSVATNYGYTSSAYRKSMVQRFCDTDLVNYHNKALTSIRFYARNGATAFKAVVYKGGSFNGDYNPGTLVLSQDIDLSTLNMGAWNTVTLNTPVMVDATQELWFGIYVEAPTGTYCMPVNSQAMPKKGCICGTHATSGAVTWSEFKEQYSFCIIGTVKNVQQVTDYTVARNGATIGTTTSNSLTDHASNFGTYTYTVTANWDNACSALATGSVTVTDPCENALGQSQTESTCGNYEWHGQTYTESGTYFYPYTDTQGCPVTDTLRLSVHPSYDTAVNYNVCESELPFYFFTGDTTYEFNTQLTDDNPQTIQQSFALTSAHGCDSLVLLTLHVFPNSHHTQTDTACDNYYWNGKSYNNSGTYT